MVRDAGHCIVERQRRDGVEDHCAARRVRLAPGLAMPLGLNGLLGRCWKSRCSVMHSCGDRGVGEGVRRRLPVLATIRADGDERTLRRCRLRVDVYGMAVELAVLLDGDMDVPHPGAELLRLAGRTEAAVLRAVDDTEVPPFGERLRLLDDLVTLARCYDLTSRLLRCPPRADLVRREPHIFDLEA